MGASACGTIQGATSLAGLLVSKLAFGRRPAGACAHFGFFGSSGAIRHGLALRRWTPRAPSIVGLSHFRAFRVGWRLCLHFRVRSSPVDSGWGELWPGPVYISDKWMNTNT